MIPSDNELLVRYWSAGEQAPFTELVNRHLGLVHAAALRITRQAALSEEVSQLVFTKLARLGSPLKDGLSLITWLHRTTRSISIDLLRAETRRRKREETAATLAMTHTTTKWEEIAPVLDEVIDRIPDEDRHIVLCRYFEGRSHGELARSLGISEDAMRMRVNRALEKIRILLQKRGISTTASALSLALPAYGMGTLPAGLSAAVIQAATTAIAPTMATTTLGILIMTHKTIIAAGAAILLIAGTFTYMELHKVEAVRPLGSAASGPPGSPASGDLSASSPGGPGAANKQRGSNREPKVAEDQGLVLKYGESRTKMANRVAGDFVHFAASMDTFAAEGLLLHPPKAKITIDKGRLGEDNQGLNLNEAQQEACGKLLKDLQARKSAKEREFINRIPGEPQAISEYYLAQDAFAKGSITKDGFDQVRARTIEVLGGDPADVGMGRATRPTDSPLADEAFRKAMMAELDPQQAAVFQKAVDESLSEVAATPAGFAGKPLTLEQNGDLFKTMQKSLDALLDLARIAKEAAENP